LDFQEAEDKLSLKHRKSTYFVTPDVLNEASVKEALATWARTLFDTFGNIYDDQVSNGLFINEFGNNCFRLLAGLRLKRTSVASSPYAMETSDCYLGVDTSSARTINLLAASSAGAGRMVVIKDETGSANTHNITVNRAGTDTIDGATSKTINAAYGLLRLISTGSGWAVI